MDPNANLKRQLQLVALLLHETYSPTLSRESLEELARELATRVQALDEWVMKGGFLPDDWAIAQMKRDGK